MKPADRGPTSHGGSTDALGPHGVPGASEVVVGGRRIDPRDLLAFERTAPTHPSRKARAVRERFGMRLAVYYSVLLRIVDGVGPAIDPETCDRIVAERERWHAERVVPDRVRVPGDGHLRAV